VRDGCCARDLTLRGLTPRQDPCQIIFAGPIIFQPAVVEQTRIWLLVYALRRILAWFQGQSSGITPAPACLVPHIFHWSKDFSSRRPSILWRLASLRCPPKLAGSAPRCLLQRLQLPPCLICRFQVAIQKHAFSIRDRRLRQIPRVFDSRSR
jgi:hypothetical protein